MSSLANALQEFGRVAAQASPMAASMLIASVWRGLLLAIAVALMLKLVPRLSAGVRSVIWLCVLAVVMVSPLLGLGAAHVESALPPGALRLDARWSYALMGVWAAFSALRLLQLAVSAWQLRALARRSVPITVEGVVARVLQTSRRRVLLCVSAEVDRPSAVGFFRARILLPDGLRERLSESELEHIVLHELEHLRRRDDWTNLLQQLALALLPLHPVVLWLDRRLCLERELACDDGVLRATEARKSYAACLTSLAEQSMLRRGVSLALGALGSWKPKSEVARRVCRILAAPQAAMTPLQSRAAAGVLLAGVVAGTFALAHTPHLVSFAPEAQTATAAAMTEEPNVVLPARSAVVRDAVVVAPHAVLAKDVATPRAINAVMRVAAPKPTMKRVPQQRRVAQSLKSARVQPTAPTYRLAAWQDDELPAPRFALAIQQDSQFTYAAVPVRGGWLIFQI